MAEVEMPPEPRWLFYVLSFFMPVAGIVVGAIYMGKADPDSRTFGKNCVITAVVCIGIASIFSVVAAVALVLLECYKPGSL